MKLFMNSKRIEDTYSYKYFIFIQEKYNENKMCIISSFLEVQVFVFLIMTKHPSLSTVNFAKIERIW